jgi:hypothetical protein
MYTKEDLLNPHRHDPRIHEARTLTSHHSPDRDHEHAKAVADGAERHFSGGIDPRVGGKPKTSATPLKIHGGMVSTTRAGILAHGGDHASYANAVESGGQVVPNKDGTTLPHPLTAATLAKQFIGKPSPIHPSMRHRNDDALSSADPGTAHDRQMARRAETERASAALGQAVITEALTAKRFMQEAPKIRLGMRNRRGER